MRKQEDFYQRYGVSAEGLVLWLDQSDGRSYGDIGNWYDLSGNGNHGTQGNGANQPAITGAIGLAGSCRDFDGGDDFMSISDTGFPIGASARTMGVWFKMGADFGTLIVYGTEANGKRFSLAYIDSTPDFIGVGVAGHSRGFNWANDNDWHLLIAIVPTGSTNSNDILLYFDGTLQSLVTKAGGVKTLNTTLNIAYLGRNVAGATLDYLLSEVFILARALSDAEIQRLYLAGAPRHGGL